MNREVRVLVAHHEQDFSKVLSCSFREMYENLEILVSSDSGGQEALVEEARTFSADLIFFNPSRIILGDDPGGIRKCCDALRQALPELRIVLVTGWKNLGELSAREINADGVVMASLSPLSIFHHAVDLFFPYALKRPVR